ncbi:hypothetical protein FB451DRAFT_1184160 [Mycena latifolia]|nr:hypothetical protein FB451DRAFT_1184160 [Mycena latifolia]
MPHSTPLRSTPANRTPRARREEIGQRGLRSNEYEDEDEMEGREVGAGHGWHKGGQGRARRAGHGRLRSEGRCTPTPLNEHNTRIIELDENGEAAPESKFQRTRGGAGSAEYECRTRSGKKGREGKGRERVRRGEEGARASGRNTKDERRRAVRRCPALSRTGLAAHRPLVPCRPLWEGTGAPRRRMTTPCSRSFNVTSKFSKVEEVVPIQPRKHLFLLERNSGKFPIELTIGGKHGNSNSLLHCGTSNVTVIIIDLVERFMKSSSPHAEHN